MPFYAVLKEDWFKNYMSYKQKESKSKSAQRLT